MMKQPDDKRADKFQTNEQEIFFDTAAVETAHPVVPLAQIDTPTAAANTNDHFRVPVTPPARRFNPLLLALILLPAAIVFAGIGTFLYNSQARDNSKGVPEINETVIQAEQINVEAPPAAKPAPVVSKNALTLPSKKSSEDATSVEEPPAAETEDSVSIDENLDELRRSVELEKIDKEQDDEDAPEIKRERKETKKQEKLERKNKREKRQNRDLEKVVQDNNDDDN